MANSQKEKKGVTRKVGTAVRPITKVSKYEEKFKIEGTFEDIIKKLVTPKR